ncbi:uncharacterized protein FOMMEDRAFT_19163 [Fomitiporia mediterranea MF3/22]|uniref:uncharacterized protein n=1 Tax=Fomitiporia mediterranea (strain MF3/22) TaxID=694068 RepID=UPI0004408C77|nr:uncharacterized protein FOMMEDRAFT_19163 [Fomitiporia mediterranea MF3/22]EJD03813.1 hypothetical protein FOMMEDRAFT_19163 [Fomitiporia mediterranea MF3/22]
MGRAKAPSSREYTIDSYFDSKRPHSSSPASFLHLPDQTTELHRSDASVRIGAGIIRQGNPETT